MRKIFITGILTFVLIGNIICQVQEQDIYNAINILVDLNKVESLQKKSKTIEIQDPIQNDFIDWCVNHAEEKIDKSSIDSTFIFEQTTTFNQLNWDKRKINKEIKIKKKATHYFSIPVFLNNRKDIFIVYHSEYYGPLAASGTYELYQKIENEWKLKTIMLVWIA